MNFSAVRWVLQAALDGGFHSSDQQQVALFMAVHADAEWKTFVGVDRLADLAHIERRRIMRGRAELEAMGAIEKVKDAAGNPCLAGNTRRAIVWRLRREWSHGSIISDDETVHPEHHWSGGNGALNGAGNGTGEPGEMVRLPHAKKLEPKEDLKKREGCARSAHRCSLRLWKPTAELLAWARAERPDLEDLNLITDKFVEHHYGMKLMPSEIARRFRDWVYSERKPKPAAVHAPQLSEKQRIDIACARLGIGPWMDETHGQVCQRIRLAGGEHLLRPGVLESELAAAER